MEFELGHRPALDGLRGCAIALVVALHFGLFKGGFIGVEVFFVLSGFLITALLLEERAGSGRVHLGRFYARRALRLFPALAVLLVALCVFVALDRNGWATAHFGRDLVGAVFYVANWVFARAGNQPDLLTHTWSLSVEEQFYLVWPLLLTTLVARRVSYRTLLVVCCGGVVLSAVARYALFASQGVDRAYFGTDTRAAGLLTGCALAVLAYAGWTPRGAKALLLTRAAALGGCIVIVAVALELDRPRPLLYKAGFTAVALAAATIILEVLVSPRGPLTRALSWSPLTGLGKISYGVYLWHWPLPFIIRTVAPDAPHAARTLVALVLSLLIPLWSYRYVEQPFRRRGHRLRASSDAESRSVEVVSE